eukprot:UC1_evm1s293
MAWDTHDGTGLRTVAKSANMHPPNNVLRTSNLAGQSNWAADGLYQGQIGGLALWNRALNAKEIWSYANYSFDRRRHYYPISTTTTSTVISYYSSSSSFPVASDLMAVPRELLGLDLEFTRHDIWEGLAAELLANRMFALQPNGTQWPFPKGGGGWGVSWPGRWVPVGTARASIAPTDTYGGAGAGAVLCSATKVPCGVLQTQVADGFNSGMSFGSAIVLESGRPYSLRLVLRASATAEAKVVVTLT